MQPGQGHYYYVPNPAAPQYPGIQAAHNASMPGQMYQIAPASAPLTAMAMHHSPAAPAGLQYGAQAGYGPMQAYTQQHQQQHQQRAPAPAAAPPPARGVGPSPQGSAPKIMRAQHLGGGSPQVHSMLQPPPPQQPMYAGQGYPPRMVLVQQPSPPQHYQPQHAAPVRAPLHHYHVPPPKPTPHPQQQLRQQQQSQAGPQSNQGAEQSQQQQQQSQAAPQSFQGAGQQQQARQGGGAIMRPQQLGQQQQGPKIMRPATHGGPPMHQALHPTALRGVLPLGALAGARPPPPGQPYLSHHLLVPSAAPVVVMGAAPQQVQQQPPPHHAPLIVQGGPGARSGLGGAGGGPRAVLQAPGRKQQKRKEVVAPVERLTQDPVPRQPLNATERKEVDEWIKERKKHFPTATNLAKKEQEVKERAARGELEVLREERRRRLQDIIARQQSMGLAKAAGTQDMYFAMSRGGGRGGGGARGRGRGREWGGRGPRQFGYEAFLQAGEAPQQPHASGANSHPMQAAQQQQQAAAAGGEGPGGATAAATDATAGFQGKRRLDDGEEGGGKRPRGEGAVADHAEHGNGSVPGAPQSSAGGDAAANGIATQGLGAALASPSHPNQHQRYPPHQQQWEPRGRGGRGRGRGGRDGFVEGRGRGRGGRGGFDDGRGRGRGRERGRGRVSWQDQQHPHPHPQQQQQQWRPPRPASPTLLQKLLAKEIRQDHSYLLQAFRFFAANNFLLDYAAGAPLVLPQHQEEETQQAQQPVSLEDILANPELSLELEVSEDEPDGTAYPVPMPAEHSLAEAQEPGQAEPNAAPSSAVGEEEEEEEEEENGSSSSEEDDEEEMPSAAEALLTGGEGEAEEEGELLPGGTLLEATAPLGESMMDDVEFS